MTTTCTNVSFPPLRPGQGILVRLHNGREIGGDFQQSGLKGLRVLVGPYIYDIPYAAIANFTTCH